MGTAPGSEVDAEDLGDVDLGRVGGVRRRRRGSRRRRRCRRRPPRGARPRPAPSARARRAAAPRRVLAAHGPLRTRDPPRRRDHQHPRLGPSFSSRSAEHPPRPCTAPSSPTARRPNAAPAAVHRSVVTDRSPPERRPNAALRGRAPLRRHRPLAARTRPCGPLPDAIPGVLGRAPRGATHTTCDSE